MTSSMSTQMRGTACSLTGKAGTGKAGAGKAQEKGNRRGLGRSTSSKSGDTVAQLGSSKVAALCWSRRLECKGFGIRHPRFCYGLHSLDYGGDGLYSLANREIPAIAGCEEWRRSKALIMKKSGSQKVESASRESASQLIDRKSVV